MKKILRSGNAYMGTCGDPTDLYDSNGKTKSTRYTIIQAATATLNNPLPLYARYKAIKQPAVDARTLPPLVKMAGKVIAPNTA